MGLDPPTLTTLSPLLHGLARAQSPRLILALRPQDPLPEWITHLIYLGSYLTVDYQGERELVLEQIRASSRKEPTDATHIYVQSLRSVHGTGQVPSSKEARSRAHGEACSTVLQAMNSNAPPSASENNQQSLKLQDVSAKQYTEPSDLFDSKAYSREGILLHDNELPKTGEAIVEMERVLVKYGEKQVLGRWTQNVEDHPREGLWWTVRRGERWGIFGPNGKLSNTLYCLSTVDLFNTGSGKTTLLSLICSDHPQSYSLPIKIFGRGRLPQPGQPGISIFDIQARIGQSSPEIHAFFPRNFTLRQTLHNAWADTFLGTPRLTEKCRALVDQCLRWFESELNSDLRPGEQGQSQKRAVPQSRSTRWADNLRFGNAPFSSQRVALFLRAIVKKPDLVVLDEAFSGMDDSIRDKCMLFLAWGATRQFMVSKGKKAIVETDPQMYEDPMMSGLTEDQALICVSHVKEEVPGLVREWMCLPEALERTPPRFGRLTGPLEGSKEGWDKIWRN